MLDIDDFIRRRPFLYHLTDRRNSARIARAMQIDSASTIFRQAGQPELVTQRRAKHLIITVDGSEVRVRDQAPLRAGNIDFELGWDFARLVAALNDRVYFWPGTATSPTEYGLRHLGRYMNEGPAIIKIPSQRMFALNPTPLFCRYNSGSPRCTGGRKSPRGAKTFRTRAECDLGASEVVEVTFEGVARLPSETELTFVDEWRPLASAFAD